jgi:D-amino-acid dehydrogenase
VLFVFPSRADFEAEAFAWRLRRENGVRWLELSADELRQRAPLLSRRYTFGLLVEENGQCRDPGAYVAALVRHALAQGAELRRGKAIGFRIEGARLRAVRTEDGEIAADRAVIAAGAWSHSLASEVGDRVPLETERGYHAVIPVPEFALRYPVMPSDGKMACVMTPQGLRLAGQVELAGLVAAPNWKRAAVLRDFARQVFPDLPSDLPEAKVKVWMGHRPSTPDGLPCIGPASGCSDVVHAFGHGHVGLTAGAATARLVADLIAGTNSSVAAAPYSVRRFQ